MTSFQLPSAIFPDNAIKRAERVYQKRSVKKLRPLRRWLSRTLIWLMVVVTLIHLSGLFIASLTQRDPTPIVHSLSLLSTLLIFFTLYYHFYFMFQTISRTANSITREKEAHTWELLILTGVNARQIVRGKWWATVQQQFSRYLFLGLIRAGATAAFGIGVASSFSYIASYRNPHMELPHPLTILISAFLGILFSVASLGLSAACGVMGSAASNRSSIALLRGFVLQVVFSAAPLIILAFIFIHIYSKGESPILESVSQTIILSSGSVVDNGFNLLSYPMYVNYQYYNLESYTPIARISLDWIISALLSLSLYALLIWFALWRAEQRAVRALATPAV